MNRIKTNIRREKPSTGKIQKLKKPVIGFMEFLAKYSIVGMAMGIIIGQTTKDTVNALVVGIISPTIQLLLPKTDFQNLVINVKGAEFQIGLFLNSFIEMLIILGILYFLVGFLLKRDDLLLKGKRPK